MTREYAVVFEQTATGWSAHAPDLPDLGVAGESFEETETLIRDGIDLRLEAMHEDGLPISEPKVRVATMRVNA